MNINIYIKTELEKILAYNYVCIIYTNLKFQLCILDSEYLYSNINLYHENVQNVYYAL